MTKGVLEEERVFIVYVREVYIQSYRTLARTKKEAVELVARGLGEALKACYSFSLEPDTWTVKEITKGEENEGIQDERGTDERCPKSY